jgi:hypothetical protein
MRGVVGRQAFEHDGPNNSKQDQTKPNKIAWICLVLFVRIRAFQWVTSEKIKKSALLSARRWATRQVSVHFPTRGLYSTDSYFLEAIFENRFFMNQRLQPLGCGSAKRAAQRSKERLRVLVVEKRRRAHIDIALVSRKEKRP